ncbi:hypothetical protein M422DRAFT_239837 [Sphaerobolus stellatus SS14]|nr:hypothetical protein M422DRAFT_239837 [Sphaerobolus stellatus SS14]
MALTYNQPNFSHKLLERHKNSPPSFTINLYDDHWTLNKGPSKFLYTQPVSNLLDEVRALRIPVDFIEIFDMAGVPYYEGCMIVEKTDHRKQKQPQPQPQTQPQPQQAQNQNQDQSAPETVRLVLHPNAETLYADLCLLNAKLGNKLTDMEAIELESKILTATLPPLHLDPDPNFTRIVNKVVRQTTPAETVLKKRKQVQEPEEDENDKAKRAKLWSQYMHPHNGKPSTLTTGKRSIFDILHEVADKDEKGTYQLKHKPEPKAVPSLAVHAIPRTTPVAATASVPAAAPTAPAPAPPPVHQQQPMPTQKPRVEPPKTAAEAQAQAILARAKAAPMRHPTAPVTTPSPANDHKKMAPPQLSQAARTPQVPPINLSKSPAQFPPPVPRPSASPRPPVAAVAPTVQVTQQPRPNIPPKKPEVPGATQPPHPPPQVSQVIPPEMQAAWQQPPPPATYLSKPPQPKNRPQPAAAHAPQQQLPPQSQPQAPAQAQPQARKQTQTPPQTQQQPPQQPQPQPQAQAHPPQPQQPQQGSPYPTHAQTPGFVGATSYPQNAVYRNAQGMVQNPNANAVRASPMPHAQQVMTQNPMQAHSQSPHPPPQQPAAAQGSPAPQHQIPHPSQHQQYLQHLQRGFVGMQAQPHPQAMAQAAIPQQHHVQQPTAGRPTGQEAPQNSQQAAMIYYNLQYQQMLRAQQQQAGTANGMRMPGVQGAAGQYMAPGPWGVPMGRGNPMAPMHMSPQQAQAFQHQQMMAAMRAQAQQAQQGQQGHPAAKQPQGGVQR